MSEYQNNPDYAQPQEGAPDWSPYYDATLNGQRHPMQEDKPEPGYYCVKLGNGARVAVGFWHGADGLDCLYREPGDEAASKAGANRQTGLWKSCARHAITKALCCEALLAGRWADEPPQESESNLPADPFENLLARVNSKFEFVDGWYKDHSDAQNKAEADRAKNYADEFRKLASEGDNSHEREKKYWLDGGRAVDNRYRFRDKLREWAKKLDGIWQAFDRKEAKRLQAEAEAQRRKAAEEARQKREEELKRQEEERAQLAAAHPGIEPPAPPPEAPEPIVQLPIAPVKGHSYGGATGRRASLPRTYIGKIVDLIQVYQHFQDELNPIIEREAQKLIDAKIKLKKADTVIPGVEIWDDLENNITAQRAAAQNAEAAA